MNIDIENYIQKQLEEIDIAELVRRELRAMVADEFKSTVAPAVRKEVDAIIKAELEACFSKPIKTNNGWGERNEYASLDDLFKQEFYKRLESSYEMKNTIKKLVEAKVSDLMKQHYDAIAKKMANELTKAAS